MAIRPGGEYASRPLHIIWLLDCSGSMGQGGKIEALNNAIREVIPAMKQAADGNPEVQFFVRAIQFSTGASWHIADAAPLNEFKWVDLTAGGETDMGQAFRLVTADLDKIPTQERMLPPQLVLVSDGKPTDDWRDSLQALLNQPWGSRAVRQAIAIGNDADHETLRKFINHPERPVIRADNAEQLVRYFRYVSTSVTGTGSAAGSSGLPPVPKTPAFDDSVW